MDAAERRAELTYKTVLGECRVQLLLSLPPLLFRVGGGLQPSLRRYTGFVES